MSLTHVTEIRVRWSECDPAGIVYFPHYFTYFELGCSDYVRSRNATWRALAARFGVVSFPRVEAHAHYRASARYEDVVAVHTHVSHVARKVITFEFRIYRQADGVLLTEGHMKIAPTNAQRRAAEISPAFAEWLLGTEPLDAPDGAQPPAPPPDAPGRPPFAL